MARAQHKDERKDLPPRVMSKKTLQWQKAKHNNQPTHTCLTRPDSFSLQPGHDNRTAAGRAPPRWTSESGPDRHRTPGEKEETSAEEEGRRGGEGREHSQRVPGFGELRRRHRSGRLGGLG